MLRLPDPLLDEEAAEAAGAAMGKWDASIESSKTTIYVYRPDLSTKM